MGLWECQLARSAGLCKFLHFFNKPQFFYQCNQIIASLLKILFILCLVEGLPL